MDDDDDVGRTEGRHHPFVVLGRARHLWNLALSTDSAEEARTAALQAVRLADTIGASLTLEDDALELRRQLARSYAERAAELADHARHVKGGHHYARAVALAVTILWICLGVACYGGARLLAPHHPLGERVALDATLCAALWALICSMLARVL